MAAKDDLTPSQHIDQFIKELTDWRGKWMRSGEGYH